MNYAQAQRAARRKITVVQVVLVSAVAALFWLTKGWQGGAGALFGSVIVALNVRMQVWQLSRADRIAGLSPERNMRYLYRCSAERFLATVTLLAIGIGVLKLEPLPLLAGYIVAQIAMVYQWFLESSARRKHG